MRKTPSYLLFIATTMSVLTVSCASDQMASPAGDRLTDEEFCAEIKPIAPAIGGDSGDILVAMVVLKSLIETAPTDELQSAIKEITKVLDKLSSIEGFEEGSDFMSVWASGNFEALEILNQSLLSEEFQESGGILADYIRGVCSTYGVLMS